MSIRACIFDLDGTLADTYRDITEAANLALAPRGLPTFEVATFRRFLGRGARKMFEQALVDRPDVDITDVLAEFRDHYSANLIRHTTPFDGIAPLLETLLDRNVGVSVLSNKPHELTVRVVSELFRDVPWKDVRGHREPSPAKPDPTTALEQAAAFALEPASIAFIGDTETDVNTARNAGMRSIAVAWGSASPDELVAAGASVVVEHPRDIPSLLA